MKAKSQMSVLVRLCCLELLSTLLDVFPRHSSSQDCVPVNEEGLREIGLDPDSLKVWTNGCEHCANNVEKYTNLMMNVMIIRIVTTEHLERVKGEAVATVIIDRFHGTECE